jgi:hypothetical protein
MKYTEEMFIKHNKETDKLLHFLQECKFSGSWDTKVDLNVIIKTIANYQFVMNNLRNEIKELEGKVKTLLEEKN